MSNPNEQDVYQANPETLQVLQQARDQAYATCKGQLNRTVRVQLLNGMSYEGVIVNVDPYNLYLRVNPYTPNARFFYGPNDLILTLSLYVLLVITLMSV